jgi:G3E family GTPase
LKRKSKIPVTVITGFLGAGKTTFINHLLEQKKGKQFALVENEFGDVPIDTKLISGVDASQMFELKQGCICCTISDEYELVLKELAERFPEVDHLLIETTGIADPGPVIQPFFRDEELKEIYQFNGTICLVDALTFQNNPETEISIKQLVIADLVLMNKSENLLAAKKALLKNEIETVSPFAKILFAEFGVANFNLDQIESKRRSEFDVMSYQTSHSHIQTKTLSFSNPVNKDEFINWISYTLDIYKNQIYRCKGILCFENEPYEYILQGVGGSFEVVEGDIILEEMKSEVVFIGKLEGLNLMF